MSSCILVYGGKGVGKSWLVLRLSELIDRKFGLNKVKFSPTEFFQLMDKERKAGMCVLYDEAGIGSNARDAQTRLNKHLSFIAQAIRPSRVTVFFTSPSWKLIDSQVRNLMDYAIEVEGHDKLSGLTSFKFFKVVANSMQQEPMRKHLVFNNEYKSPVKYISWVAHAPSKGLGESYNTMRDDYSNQLYKDAAETGETGQDVRFGKKKAKEVKPLITMMAKEVAANPKPFMNNGKLESFLVAEHYKVGRIVGEGVVRLAKSSLMI